MHNWIFTIRQAYPILKSIYLNSIYYVLKCFHHKLEGLTATYTIFSYSRVPDRSTQILIKRKEKHKTHWARLSPASPAGLRKKLSYAKSVDVNHQSLYIGPKLRAAVCLLSSGDSPETVCIYFTEPYLSYPELLPCRG